MMAHYIEVLCSLGAVTSIVKVRRSHIGQDLRCLHLRRVEVTGLISVEVERAKPSPVQAHGEGEHRGQACVAGARREAGKAVIIDAEICNYHRLTGAVRLQARPLVQLVLQYLDLTDGVI